MAGLELENRLLTPMEVSIKIHQSLATIYIKIRTGELPSVAVPYGPGGLRTRRMVPASAVEALVAARRATGAA